jgi:hypothetical protein
MTDEPAGSPEYAVWACPTCAASGESVTSAKARSLQAIEDGDGDLLSNETLGGLIGLDLAMLVDGWPALTDEGREALAQHGRQR